MSQVAARRMTADEFLEWDLDQDEAHELVDGVVMVKHLSPTGMVGASTGHDTIFMNAAREMGAQLRGSRCRPFSEAVAVRIPPGSVRRPDLGVQCAPFDEQAAFAREPRLVMEVLSRSTRAVVQTAKLEGYKTVASVDYILLVEPDAPEVTVWSRDALRRWEHGAVAGLDAAVPLPALGIELKLADLYEGLTFRRPPRRVLDDVQR